MPAGFVHEIRWPTGDEAFAPQPIEQIAGGKSLANICAGVQFAAGIEGLASFRNHVRGEWDISRNYEIAGCNQTNNVSVRNVHSFGDTDAVDERRGWSTQGLIGDKCHRDLALFAARYSSSLISPGHPSASTQICMARVHRTQCLSDRIMVSTVPDRGSSSKPAAAGIRSGLWLQAVPARSETASLWRRRPMCLAMRRCGPAGAEEAVLYRRHYTWCTTMRRTAREPRSDLADARCTGYDVPSWFLRGLRVRRTWRPVTPVLRFFQFCCRTR